MTCNNTTKISKYSNFVIIDNGPYEILSYQFIKTVDSRYLLYRFLVSILLGNRNGYKILPPICTLFFRVKIDFTKNVILIHFFEDLRVVVCSQTERLFRSAYRYRNLFRFAKVTRRATHIRLKLTRRAGIHSSPTS